MHFDHLDEIYAMVQYNWQFDNVTQTGLNGLHGRSDWFAQIVQQTLAFANFGCQQYQIDLMKPNSKSCINVESNPNSVWVLDNVSGVGVKPFR